jgi:hypothetical protein
LGARSVFGEVSKKLKLENRENLPAGRQGRKIKEALELFQGFLF